MYYAALNEIESLTKPYSHLIDPINLMESCISHLVMEGFPYDSSYIIQGQIYFGLYR